MQVKKVVLDNIRSYTHSEMNFPEGSMLLSGNIGSGKSTVLMAIEFALFGLRRSELSGASLLRNGADKGYVEVLLGIGGKDVRIGRSLKRTSSGVSQEAGFIEENGARKALTAIEIKQRVLELLNYPKEALTKNEMLYRYTVYVSQEEMKQILLGDKEARLNALRHVFGIDKYRKIKENAKIVSSKAGERKKELIGCTSDLDAKKNLRTSRAIELDSVLKELNEAEPKAKEAAIKAEEARLLIEALEQDIKKSAEMRKELSFCEQKARLYEIQKANEEKELKRLEEKIRLNSPEKVSGKDFAKERLERREKIKQIEAEINSVSAKIHELNARKKACEELKRKISMLDKCPTCMQDVKEEHKQGIHSAEDAKLAEIEKEFALHSGSEKALREAVSKINNELDLIYDEEKKELLAKAQLKEAEEAMRLKSSVEERLKKAGEELLAANMKKEALAKGLAAYAELEKKQMDAKKSLEVSGSALRQIELKKAQLEARKEMTLKSIEEITADIKEKEELKKGLKKVSMLKEWLDYYFMQIAEDMEKTVMAKAHSEFDSLLSKWFSMLVDNESVAIRLDTEFTPVIEQNGYEIDYGYLSGGEKTAAALAYRLALNQVVNNMMGEIQTKDIIILDEPTDGFSEEQLEKMKNVLDELSIGQVIIVSHEQKIESFVSNVIRFEKSGHESSVVGSK
ncbi:MAG: hypothetical protein PHO02_02240 [Candidatus Nanoarchaeia archaeon]|nr:hypothetical protein [Candidatus Nanoarchaeia archaeon]